jgi:hypothetical protein
VRDVLRIAIPLTVWLAAFSTMYGLEGLVCSGHGTGGALMGRTVLVAIALAAVALQIVLLLALRSASYGSQSPFVRHVSVTLAIAALVATIWTFIPVAATSICL